VEVFLAEAFLAEAFLAGTLLASGAAAVPPLAGGATR